MLKFSTALVLVMLLQMPAWATSDASWYKENPIMDHNNHPDFYFLVGDWESSDPSINFKESWNTTANGDLFGYRSFKEGDVWVYDLFAFEQSMLGATVNMRQMGLHLCDRSKNQLIGSWIASINHRGEIKFQGTDLEILNQYDSPDPNTVNLHIRTTSKGVTTSKKLTLKRVTKQPLPPNS